MSCCDEMSALQNVHRTDQQMTSASRVPVYSYSAMLAVVLGLRVYAAVATVPIRTWDDLRYRLAAYGEFNAGVSFPATLIPEPHAIDVWLPYLVLLDGGAKRVVAQQGMITAGYHDWLVAAFSLAPGQPENAFQALNVLALLVQLALVFLAFRWAGSPLALPVTCLYVTAPVVFGINRWVLTENHVMVAMLAVPFVSAGLVASTSSGRRSEILKGAATGLVVGVLSATREYVAPTVFAFAVMVPLLLLLSRRFAAAAAFVSVAAPFLLATGVALVTIVPSVVMKLGLTDYSHDVTEIVPHYLRHFAGYPQAALLLVGAAAAVTSVRRGEWPIRALLVTQLLLAALYLAIFAISDNRTARGLIPVVWSVFGAVPLALRITGPRRFPPVVLAVATAFSCAFLFSQLFVDGTQWGHHPTALEVFNHPLELRPLRGPFDMHVVTPEKPE